MNPLTQLSRTLVMGVLNVTPDSFSDGGCYAEPTVAIARGRKMLAEGADIIDVGGESTRPGAQPVSVETELERVVGVVLALAQAGAVISIDTTRARVAQAAVAAGATVVNDVSGGLADPKMLATVADLGVGYVIGHWRGPLTGTSMTESANYRDVVGEVRAELAARLAAARQAGIDISRVVLDPGLGFSKTADHNWALLANLDSLAELGRPLLVGASRKRFLGELLADETGLRPPVGRDAATIALATLIVEHELWGVRTHTVREHRDAITVAAKLKAARAASHVSQYRSELGGGGSEVAEAAEPITSAITESGQL